MKSIAPAAGVSGEGRGKIKRNGGREGKGNILSPQPPSFLLPFPPRFTPATQAMKSKTKTAIATIHTVRGMYKVSTSRDSHENLLRWGTGVPSFNAGIAYLHLF